MTDIIDLIRADHLQVMHWAARFGELSPDRSAGVSRPLLVLTWRTLASLLDLHMSAEDEICTPAIFGTGRKGLALARQARDDRDDVREIVAETNLCRPASPQWWELARAALVAWSEQLDEETHGPIAQYRRRADPALRHQLTARWRAFTAAQIRDWWPQAPPRLPVHQLRQDKHAPLAVPRLALPMFAPLACICRGCNERLGEAFRVQ